VLVFVENMQLLSVARILNSVTSASVFTTVLTSYTRLDKRLHDNIQWEGEIYSDASSLERTPWVSAWPIADIVHTRNPACASVHSAVGMKIKHRPINDVLGNSVTFPRFGNNNNSV